MQTAARERLGLLGRAVEIQRVGAAGERPGGEPVSGRSVSSGLVTSWKRSSRMSITALRRLLLVNNALPSVSTVEAPTRLPHCSVRPRGSLSVRVTENGTGVARPSKRTVP